jgi:ribosomal protein S18 acetylase RimI-like enzyme
VLVAGDPVAPHGFITLEPGEPAHIGLLAVGAAHRGKGLGRRLVLEAERLCTVQGTFSLWVATQGSNQPARRLYERCGFMQETVVAQFHAWFPE